MISETFAEARRVLLAAIEQAEQAQRRSRQQSQELFEATRDCAADLQAEIGQTLAQLEEVRTSVGAIQGRLSSLLAQIDSVAPQMDEVERPGVPPPSEPAPPLTGDDTVRVLRAALELLSHQRSGDSAATV